MAKQLIDIGVEGNDGTGDSIRESFRKANENFNELYAVFGIGGQIGFIDLDDTPEEYIGNENKIPVVKSDGSGIEFRELASDNALDGSDDTINFDFSVDGKLILSQAVSRLSSDTKPSLSAPLNASTQPIGNVEITQEAVDSINSVHGTDLTLDDLVIDKGYGDQNYLPKTIPGAGVRIGDEPNGVTQYTITAGSIINGNFRSVDHGLTAADTGNAYIFNSTGTDPFGVTTGGTVYVRAQDADNIKLYDTQSDAINNVAPILLSGGSGTFSITESAYDSDLQGNWLSNVGLPRKSVVRRQGDTMTGALTLHDHPGDLAGTGTPNGSDDLQAATKLYVDNATGTSQVNLYVSTSGDDNQVSTPTGKSGRNIAYAFRTINRAARRAEEILESSPIEIGPYVQTITFNSGKSNSAVITGAFDNAITDGSGSRINAKRLINQNKNFIVAETIAYLLTTYPNLQYDSELYKQDLEYILDSVALDIQFGNNANSLSIWAGKRLYGEINREKNIFDNLTETLAGVEYARSITINNILTNTAVSTSYQDRYSQVINSNLDVDDAADNAVAARFDDVVTIMNDGVLNAPALNEGNVIYKINISNGNYGFVDQGNPNNTDIIAGKIIRGKTSGAIAVITEYIAEDGDVPVDIEETDEIELRLLEPIEFILGEELEYGNSTKEQQISILVESGTYYEDFPIRVPTNVSLVGDQFRRTIVKPRDRVSQSRYSNLFFYRDAEFDGLVLGNSTITTIGNFSGVDNSAERSHHDDSTPLVYTVTDQDYTTSNIGSDAIFTVTVYGDGSVDVAIQDGGTGFLVDEIVTIPDSSIGNQGGPQVQFSVTETANGKPYINPLTGNTDGHYGNHYLKYPDNPFSTGPGYVNSGNWNTASVILEDNLEFIKEQAAEYVEQTYPSVISKPEYNSDILKKDVGVIVKAYAQDLIAGGNENTLQAQGDVYLYATQNDLETETLAGYNYVKTIVEKIFVGEQPDTIYGTVIEYTQADTFNGSALPEDWSESTEYTVGNRVKSTLGDSTTRYYVATANHTSTDDFLADRLIYWTEIDGPIETVENFDSTVSYAFDENYNPPLRNDQIDAFLLNDGTILQNISIQGQGGFGAVLDPEGQIKTKSPFIQSCSSFSKSANKQAFRGGLYIDGFCGNTVVRVVSKVDANAFRLSVSSFGSQSDPQGLFVKKPQIPCVFYIDGKRFQVNEIARYDQDAGTAEIILDKTSNDGNGFTGITGTGPTGVDLDSATAQNPVDIVLQTSGNRSVLGNDFTQVNDLGYGLVAANGALSEMVSVFTYYCWTSYYSKNGGQIRSLTGSSCYGEYGLISEGSDPNEIPDSIELGQDMSQPVKSATVGVVLKLSSPVVASEGDIVTQDVSDAQGVISVDTDQSHGNTIIYLKSVQGVFNTTNAITVDSDSSAAIPYEVEILNANNTEDSLVLNVYDFKDIPASSGEIDIYHPVSQTFARYSLTSINPLDHFVGNYTGINDNISATVTTAAGSGATFNLSKTKTDGYSVSIVTQGEDYSVDDTFVVTGDKLGGATPANDATITVTQVESGGEISAASVSGTANIDPATPVYNGRIYQLNFNVADGNFVQTGLVEDVSWGEDINYIHSTGYLLTDISRTNTLVTRPSTAVAFDESPNTIYRSIAFESTNVLGESLQDDQVNAVFDDVYDYITLSVDNTNAQKNANQVLEQDNSPVGASGTLGATGGDTTIAVEATADNNEISRLNNNARTPEANRPTGWTAQTLKEAPIFSWGGKKYYIFNYRGVGEDDQVENIGVSNAYALVDIADTGDEINQTPTSGLSKSIVLTNATAVIRAGLAAGADGDITINISTCRATSHDFLEVGTGGYNTTNYPNIIFGDPRTPDQSKEVEERTKGRVFYVSTDQDGIFRVGRFFNVDQGTGDITFSGSLALSNVNGIGFRRGVVVSEFSTDSSFADNATDTVPTESATRGYISRRLGFDDQGVSVSNPIGPGVLTSNGSVPLTDDLNAGNNSITNLKAPQNDNDAATKAYVDTTVGGNDTLGALRDVEQNSVSGDQLLVTTGYQKVILGTPTEGVFDDFTIGSVFTGSESGAQGTIRDRFTESGLDGFVLHLIYDTSSGTVQSDDSIIITGIAAAPVVDGPMEEWANGVWSANSDVEISTTRQITQAGGLPSARYTELDLQYKANSIVNSDVNANAAIAQSKLNMNAATTRANASGITQNERGLASFDSANFTATSGWISLKANGINLSDIQKISSDTVLGNSTASTANVSEIAFSTVVNQGGGTTHTDFSSTVSAGSDPGQALIKTGSETYGITNVSLTGEPNSIVKTNISGDIQVNSLILGGDSNYQILSLSGLELQVKTPAQGTILTASGSSGNVTVEFPESVDIGNTGVSESVLQTASNLSGEAYLGVDWIYSSFIEAPGERGAASTGIAIGIDNGVNSANGQVAIVTAGPGTNTSSVPFRFDKDGALPDANNTYNIGSNSRRYAQIFTTTLNTVNIEGLAADLAENYTADDEYEPGTVVVFGGEQEITTTTQKGDSRVAGVITTEPAYVMNSALESEHVACVALQGRVPCKVLGTVRKGDVIVSASVPGYAMATSDPKPGTIIGKSLENKTTADKGMIEIAIGRT